MGKTISIIGCGWFGLPLAKFMIDKGWTVKGSTTSENKFDHLKQIGILPCLLDVARPETFKNDFFKSDYILINIPPTKVMRQVSVYWPLIKVIEKEGAQKVIFISSTSVYPSNNSIVYEEDTERMGDGVNQLLDIERAFQKAAFECAIIRFAGLVGGERYPGRFFTPERVVDGGSQVINLIHLDDCIQIVEQLLKQDAFNNVFNGVADTHPQKKEFYTLAAQLNNKPAPKFSQANVPYKIISNEKVKRHLNIIFKHPDLIEMLHNNELWNRT
ncbi:NAD(P)-binding domain-containing protein [Carboxylicivirga marina]|uniref:6-phosphogluconate dehydrogenase NADP-binding domain-containing protein n=1 Tax=Carboxylicivirga marina TaxID=2800988 RepID=A0ABS1HJS6_9BACT|nr:NAD(P)-binding domain-containing protein [Carboxylicivirga marina]MBK3517846.1 hypothetical protein [Carboxylicivirga marina]